MANRIQWVNTANAGWRDAIEESLKSGNFTGTVMVGNEVGLVFKGGNSKPKSTGKTKPKKEKKPKKKVLRR